MVVVCDTGKLLDEIVASAFNDQSRFDVLGSSVARHDAESVFLWQIAVGLPVEPAAAVISTMHRSALHSGNSISLVNFLLSSCCFSSYLLNYLHMHISGHVGGARVAFIVYCFRL